MKSTLTNIKICLSALIFEARSPIPKHINLQDTFYFCIQIKNRNFLLLKLRYFLALLLGEESFIRLFSKFFALLIQFSGRILIPIQRFQADNTFLPLMRSQTESENIRFSARKYYL